MTGLDERSQNALCDGSFLKEVEEFHKTSSSNDRDKTVITLWESYFKAFQFNLVYVTVGTDSFKMNDVSTGREVDYAWTHLVVDLFEQARFVARYRRDGFYATCATRTILGYRTLTIIPKDILCAMMEDTDTTEGVFSLRTHLSL
ncbi:hypothetical protein F4782DRAFT_502174, partial [Xylaria castorea]